MIQLDYFFLGKREKEEHRAMIARPARENEDSSRKRQQEAREAKRKGEAAWAAREKARRHHAELVLAREAEDRQQRAQVLVPSVRAGAAGVVARACSADGDARQWGDSLVEETHAQVGSSEPTDELLCVICLDARRTMLLLPCRHLCLCAGCAKKCRSCPLCRMGVEKVVEVFFA